MLRKLFSLGATFCLVAVGPGCSRDAAKAESVPVARDARAPKGLGVVDHDVKTLEGEPFALKSLRGRALLLVNTASQCGYTPQYEGLQTLYERYRGRGFEVLAFPCNDFGGQEPDDAKAIRENLSKTYGVGFPVFEKQRIKGRSEDKSPLWRTLTEDLGPDLRGEVRWNFEKFVVSPEGVVVARFGSSVDPLDPALIKAVEGVLPR
jgi:glutathione peroxidase